MNSFEEIAAHGQSIWFDDLRRDLIASGELARLVADASVTGVTTNPTILARAMSESSDYDEQLKGLFGAGATVVEAYREVVTTDIRDACDVLAPVWERSGRSDGFVSVEVSPDVAHDVVGTIEEARDWARRVDRRNVLVKVPATRAGAEAFQKLTAEGVSINVTLIFSLQRYREIAQRYIAGIEQFVAAGGASEDVCSVASFFVSRVDTEVDRRLNAITSSRARDLRGRAGIANARVAYALFQRLFDSRRWHELARRGAQLQRPLWASTGVKDPSYPETMYVDELVAAHTVATIPLTTLRAVSAHGQPRRPFGSREVGLARAVLAELREIGIDYDDVTATVEREGLHKFAESFREITALLGTERERLATDARARGVPRVGKSPSTLARAR